MIEWLKDVLGVNKYIVAWRFEGSEGYWHEGNSRGYWSLSSMSKRDAFWLARNMSGHYGGGTHWIEKD